MLRKVVVVAPPSQSNHCVSCHQPIHEAFVVCGACNKLQPFPSTPPNFFEVFGLSSALEIDEPSLRRKYYELSQKTHPDTQSQTDTLNQLQASKWSTLINKAFQTLKNTQHRLEYLLESYGNKSYPNSSPPLHLAESYFELQETFLEAPNENLVLDFLATLEKEEAQNEAEFRELVSLWKQAYSKETLLPRIKKYLDTQKYLSSLKADLNKKRGVL